MSGETILAAVALTHALDAQFGLKRRTVLSQRDVPGVPRPVIPVLKHAGLRAISVGVGAQN